MSIPTVNVTVVVNGQDGSPVEGAVITAKLDREDRYEGLVVRKTVRGKTGETGQLVMALFPNVLGTSGSQYQFSIQTKEGAQRYTASVPNSDCYLSSIIGLDPAPALSAAEVVLRDANTARVKAEAAADDAEASASAAATSQTASLLAAGDAASAAEAAGGSEAIASEKAAAAAASEVAAAASLAAAELEATASAASAAASAASASESAASASASATSASSAQSSAAAADASKVAAVSAQGAAESARDAAQAAQSVVATSASQAASSASSSASSSQDAQDAAASAQASMNAAANSAVSADSSADSASASASLATTKASDAAASAATATTKAAEAAASAGSISTAAATATAKAAEAVSSASAAASSASTASTKASEAATSASQSASSAATASSAANTAAVKAGEAATSATNAAASGATATTKAGEASASATSAASSASTAATKASEAAASAALVPANAAASIAYFDEIASYVSSGKIDGVPQPIFTWTPWLTKALHPSVTFSRASQVSYFDGSGVLRYANNGVPRFDHDPLTGICKGLLVEPSVTFLDTYSEQFDDAAWAKARASITANATTAPDGTMTADKLVEDTTASNTHSVYRSGTSISSATAYSISVWAKRPTTGGRNLGIRFDGGFPSSWAKFNTYTGTLISADSGITTTVDKFGDGWIKYTATQTSNGATTYLSFYLLDDSGNQAYTGDGTSGLYIWGAKLYAGTGPTSYLPTTTAGVTRAADVCSVDLTKLTRNGSPLWTGTEGTIVVRFSARGGGANRLYTLSDDTGSYTIQGRVLGTYFDINVNNNGTVSLDGYNYGYAGYTDACLLVSYDRSSGEVSYCSNGGSVYSSSGVTIPLVTQLYIGSNKTGSYYLNGWVRSVQLYNRRIADSYLPAMSAL